MGVRRRATMVWVQEEQQSNPSNEIADLDRLNKQLSEGQAQIHDEEKNAEYDEKLKQHQVTQLSI